MNLIDKFLDQPISVRIVEIYLLFVLLLMAIIFPIFTLVLFSSAFTVLSIMYLIIYFVTKGEVL